MTATSITLMLIAIVLVWGGLIAAIVGLRAFPQPDPEVVGDHVVVPEGDNSYL
ncbi:MAG: methionine/alanine import family NSS transporter small subunit [Actinomycetaceae bacterium]|nr:methionine/alanine import family NSS transporter small subunit [Actinomycetaceae bacterium]